MSLTGGLLSRSVACTKKNASTAGWRTAKSNKDHYDKAQSTKHFRNKINFTYPARRADHATPPALSDTLPACPTAHPTTAAHLAVGGLEVFPHSQTGHFLPHLKKAKLSSNMSNYFCQNQWRETVSLLKLYWFK